MFNRFLIKKVFIFLNLILLIFLFLPQKAYSQEWYAPGFREFYLKASDPSNPEEIFGERYTLAQVNWIFWSIPSFILNMTLGPELGTCVVKSAPSSIADFLNPVDNFLEFLNNGCPEEMISRLMGILIVDASKNSPNDSVFSFFQTPREPSLVFYLSEKFKMFSPIREIYAQDRSAGFGYFALGSIINMWKVTRNIAYSLLAIVIIIMAIMIMLRTKISPQVVISVENSIPKIFLALILITFSYPIAGLMVDLMFVTYGLLSIIFKGFLVGLPITTIFTHLTGGFTLRVLFITFIAAIIAAGLLTVGVIAFGFTLVFIPFLFAVPLGIIYIIMRIVFNLVKAGAMVILLTIFSPLYILLGVFLPGMKPTDWLKPIISNLSVFVTTSTMLLLSALFIHAGAGLIFGQEETIVFTTEGVGWMPIIGGGGRGFAKFILFVSGIILQAASIKAALVVKSIIEQKPFDLGSAIGEVIKGGKIIPEFIHQRTTGLQEQAYQKAMMEKMAEAYKTEIEQGAARNFFRRVFGGPPKPSKKGGGGQTGGGGATPPSTSIPPSHLHP